MLKHKYQSATADNAGSEVSSGEWNDDHDVDTTSSTPAAGKLSLLARVVTRALLAFASDKETVRLMPHTGYEQVAYLLPAHGNSTVSVIGCSLVAAGTITAASWVQTNAYTRTPKCESLVTAASTTAVAGRYANLSTGASVGGAAAGRGGFHLVMHWGPATGVATATNRAFAGLVNSTAAPTDVEPSSIANLVGMGWDAADTNVQIMHRGAGAVTKIDLGASFAVPTVDRTTMYRLDLYAPSGTTQEVDYEVTNLQTGAVASGTITTNLPLTSVGMSPRVWMSVGGTSSVIGIGCGQIELHQPLA